MLALVSAVGAAWLIVSSDRVDQPFVQALVVLLGVAAFVAAGLVAWSTRPDNRMGPLMVLTGFLLLTGSLAAADGPVAFTVGEATAPLADAVFVHLLLAFPQGRLHSGVERAIVIATYLTVTVGQWVMLLFMDYRDTPGCPCPRNLMFVVSDDAVHELIMTTQRMVGVLLAVGVVLVLAQRWRTASPPMRRSLAPVLLTGSIAAGLSAVALVSSQVADSPASALLGLAGGVAVAFVPLGFLVGLLRSRFARIAVGDLVIELGRTVAPGELRGALARALGDPSVELAYRLPESEAYVDVQGRRVVLPDEDAGRAVTFVEREGRRIAAVVHDVSLRENPALVQAACAAAGLALENERLQAELRARLDDLRASRARVVQAGDTERRRLERNLHDGAQQRLVSVSFALGLAESKVLADPAAAREILAATRQELSTSLEELRELARGIHPAVLSSRGLGAAVRALAMTAPLPVEVSIPPERFPEPAEAAAYYLITEALANASKHARANAVWVSAAREDHRMTVVISDDGVGGADLTQGSGLRGLADRVEALDGALWVTSEPGRGTTIRAELPCG